MRKLTYKPKTFTALRKYFGVTSASNAIGRVAAGLDVAVDPPSAGATRRQALGETIIAREDIRESHSCMNL